RCMCRSYCSGHNCRVAGRTSFETFTPKRHQRSRRHRVAVLAFDGVVLADLATPCEVLARARTSSGAPAYDLRVCSERPQVASEHVGVHVVPRQKPVSGTSAARARPSVGERLLSTL